MSNATPDAMRTTLADLGFDYALEADPGDEWVRLDDYIADTETLDGGLRLAGERYRAPTPSRLTAGWLIADVAALITWPTARSVLSGGPRLVVSARDVHLPHPRTKVRHTVRIAPPVGDGMTTARQVADGIVDALTPVVEAVHRRTRRGRHPLWGTVTDMTAAAFHRVGDHLGRGAEARQHATEIIATHSTLRGQTNWCDITWSGGTESTRIRNICCLWYQTDGGDLCVTCPRLTRGQRRTLIEQRSAAN